MAIIALSFVMLFVTSFHVFPDNIDDEYSTVIVIPSGDEGCYKRENNRSPLVSARGDQASLKTTGHQEDWITPIPGVITPHKIALIRDYARRHYGLDTQELKDPRMIVIHYTEIATLSNSLKYFLPDKFRDRGDPRAKFGELNVGIHFFVAPDGMVYAFYPENVIARHIIGFNHCAIGIENVALRRKDLTVAQLESDARLVKYLARKYPSIRYLIGHHEYADAARPHFRLYRELDTNYSMTAKPDPGPDFMKKLREMISGDDAAGKLAD